MIKTELQKYRYYDLVLAKDPNPYHRDFNKYKLFHIDVTEGLCSQLPSNQTQTVTLNNIALTGYDNFLLNMEGGLDPTKSHTISSGSTLCLHAVSGYTSDISYEIIPTDKNFHQLQGGFYQGFFKLFNYPITFFPARMKKGWTFNLILHFPVINPNSEILNDIITDNSGFIFYFGTRAENKLTNPLISEIEILKNYYQVETEIQYNLHTNGDHFLLNDEPYIGWFCVWNNIPYVGRSYFETSERLYYNQKYVDIINNAFGVRITPDGRIGYRNIYQTEPCYRGGVLDAKNITVEDFVDYSNVNDSHSLRKITTKYFTIEESYTKNPIIAQDDENFLFISITFERDFPYNNECELQTGEYKLGTLSIDVNGFNVYKNEKFNEVIPHVLDTYDYYQEGVPFNISLGGGTQGLFDAIFLDEDNISVGVLDRFFTGTFLGGVKSIEMFSVPLYPTEIREIINNTNSLNLFIPNGGRRVFLKNLM